jgi:CHASE2 domain-containing sensor protein
MKERLPFIHHMFIAIIAITSGLNKIDSPYSSIGWLLVVLGAVVLGYFVYTLVTKRLNRSIRPVILGVECTAMLCASYMYFAEGKQFLPYATLLAALGYFIAVIASVRRVTP